MKQAVALEQVILGDVRREIKEAKEVRSIKEIKAMLKDAPERRSFADSLKPEFGLIAEIKAKSPSIGAMRADNVRDAYQAYQNSSLVHAVSILTNQSHFGMSIDCVAKARNEISKPILRKDFILDEYQIYEARAFGADAILLMANVLDKGKLQTFWKIASDIGLDVLFEAHTLDEIKNIPRGATVCGINCRMMWAPSRKFLALGYQFSRKFSRLFGKDLTTDTSRFKMVRHLPKCVRVAESGMNPGNIAQIRELGFNAALIGTSLLTDAQGIRAALGKFESVLQPAGQKHFAPEEALAHASA